MQPLHHTFQLSSPYGNRTRFFRVTTGDSYQHTQGLNRIIYIDASLLKNDTVRHCAVLTGLEPANFCVTGRHDNQLHHSTINLYPFSLGRTRTCILSIFLPCFRYQFSFMSKSRGQSTFKLSFEPVQRVYQFHHKGEYKIFCHCSPVY